MSHRGSNAKDVQIPRPLPATALEPNMRLVPERQGSKSGPCPCLLRYNPEPPQPLHFEKSGLRLALRICAQVLLWPVAWSLLRSSARGPMDVEVRGPGFRSSGIEGTRLVLGFRSIDIFLCGGCCVRLAGGLLLGTRMKMFSVSQC